MLLFVQELITKENNNMIREKRDSRLTADISETAHNLLKDAVIKFDSSKGKLVEKMIHNFLSGDVEATEPTTANIATVEKVLVKRFVPPMQDDVFDYMKEKGLVSDDEAQKFCDFYISNGWKVGKNKMKCWKAAVRNWLKNNNGSQSKLNGKTSGNLSACEEFING
jgi:predicted Fe-Mo cluster-binding NifX family protein